MSLIADAFTLICVMAGIAFFAAGTLGLVRLPQTLSRIHALTKADNVGLALIVVGLLPQATNVLDAAKMVAVWLLAQLASGAVAQVMAEAALAEAVMAEGAEAEAKGADDASQPEESRP
ncbi:monovalent cation/H(+) antiporter subunit G [Xanthobacter autotrophicus]|uniref:monovalent cation/H(+) antiporter subunit G n=1 Tax=Xanthobacter autotrophicus TaxID=280 RepID=UPI003727B236